MAKRTPGLRARRRLVLGMQQEAPDPSARHQVRLQDLLGSLDRAVVIPDAFRIDHHGRTKLAAVEAAGLVDPHPLEAEFLHPRLQVVAQPDRPLGLAAAALVTRRTFVHAAEDVTAEKGFRVTIGGHFGTLARHGPFPPFPPTLLISL